MHISSEFIKRIATGFILGAAFWILFLYLPPIYFSYVLVIILLQIIFFEWNRLFSVSTPLFWLTLPFYPILPFALLIVMNQNPMYHDLLFILFILVSSHDTGSYIVGSLIGTHKICSISPGKTWEGFAGGCIAACIGLTLLLWEQKIPKPWWFIIIFSVIVCTLALLGDLFESWLKRRAQVKNSGDILPGHGGFLDRFDGILFAVFFFYFLRDYLVRLFE
ncbi:MAG TPA: phosphatidate cytidylyltransferase [Candidatus Dependentiae bacterium]|nr:phosphatidate cytidylyltransferase [Candidatus Dependentiae bacterium]HRQ62923.1 phosphatidate cytidylyltransferase [Candidatus Dependentiae bacterium]